MRVEWSRARRLVAVGFLSRCFCVFLSSTGRSPANRRSPAIVASGRKALGNKQAAIHGAQSAAMIDLAPLGYVLYAAAALAFIWLLQNAAQL